MEARLSAYSLLVYLIISSGVQAKPLVCAVTIANESVEGMQREIVAAYQTLLEQTRDVLTLHDLAKLSGRPFHLDIHGNSTRAQIQTVLETLDRELGEGLSRRQETVLVIRSLIAREDSTRRGQVKVQEKVAREVHKSVSDVFYFPGKGPIQHVGTSPDGKYLVAAAQHEGWIFRTDRTKAYRFVWLPAGHKPNLESSPLAFREDSRAFLVGGWAAPYAEFELSTGSQLASRQAGFCEYPQDTQQLSLAYLAGEVIALVVETNGLALLEERATRYVPAKPSLWNRMFHRPPKSDIESYCTYATALSPDGTLIAYNTPYYGVTLITRKTLARSKPFPILSMAANVMAFSPDSQILAMAGASEGYLWKRGENRLLPLENVFGLATHIAFLSNSSFAVLDFSQTVKLYSAEDGKLLGVITEAGSDVIAIGASLANSFHAHPTLVVAKNGGYLQALEIEDQ